MSCPQTADLAAQALHDAGISMIQPVDHLVLSDAFKQWFGSSQVVDSDGKPLIVFHGTTARFSEFKRSDDVGFHFGTFCQASRRLSALERKRGCEAPEIYMPVFLRIEKPLILDSDPDEWGSIEQLYQTFAGTLRNRPGDTELRAITAEIKREYNNGYSSDDSISELQQQLDDGEISEEDFEEERQRLKDAEHRDVYSLLCDLLVDHGYDGMIYRNFVEDDFGHPSYMVLDPTQIKSPGNGGGFSLQGKSIYG